MQAVKVSKCSQECTDCHTILPGAARSCASCGGKDLRTREHSRFPYDAIAAFIGVTVVIIYWLGRG
jgi:ribosomal protein L40E